MLTVGIKGTLERTVTEEVTAKAMGSGELPVFATPAVVALAEECAWKSVAGGLEEGQGTVGTRMELSHLAATPLGPYREGPGELNVPVVCGGQVVLPGDLLVGDSDGLVVIPRRDAPALLEAVRQNLAMEQEEMRHMRDGSYGEEQHKEVFTGAFLKRGGSFHQFPF